MRLYDGRSRRDAPQPVYQAANIAFLRQNAKHSARNQPRGCCGTPVGGRLLRRQGHPDKSHVVGAHTLAATLLVCVQKESTKKFGQFGKKPYICRQTQRKHGRVATASHRKAQKRKPERRFRLLPQENGTRSHLSLYWTPLETRRAKQQENVKLAHAATSKYGRQSHGYMKKGIHNIGSTVPPFAAASGRGVVEHTCRRTACGRRPRGGNRPLPGNIRTER